MSRAVFIWALYLLFGHLLAAAGVIAYLHQSKSIARPGAVIAAFPVDELRRVLDAEHPALLVRVQTDRAPSRDLPLSVRVRGGTLRAGSDFRVLTDRVVIPAGETESRREELLRLQPAAATAPPASGGDADLVVELVESAGVTVAADRSSLRVDVARLGSREIVAEFGATAIKASEGDGSASIPIQLAPAPVGEVAIRYKTSDPPAEGEIRAEAGMGEVVLRLPIANDEVNRPDRVVTVDLLPGDGVRPGEIARTKVTIRDDDPKPTLTIKAGRAEVIEGDGQTLTIVGELDAPAAEDVTARGRVVGGDLRPGIDVSGAPELLKVPAGRRIVTYEISVTDDKTPQPRRTLELAFDDVRGAKAGAIGPIRFTVDDNDTVDGDALLLIVQTDELERRASPLGREIRDLVKKPEVGGRLFRGGALLVGKAGEPTQWPPARDEALNPAGSFQPAERNAAFARAIEVAEECRRIARNPNLLTLIVWPNIRAVDNFPAAGPAPSVPDGRFLLVSLGAKAAESKSLRSIFQDVVFIEDVSSGGLGGVLGYRIINDKPGDSE